ncbi:MAG: 5'-nucleotidase C-terminal domain-containing protein [Clostridia bacterium]|nr:5'-nucleotidase C-terminal domain-containing protein [Clostridia bacterium]
MKQTRILTAILLVVSMLLLASCGTTAGTGVLKAPSISLSGHTISWDEVEGADTYEIFVNDRLFCQTSETTYTFMPDENTPRTVYVKAVGESKSKASNSVLILPQSVQKGTLINAIMLNDNHGVFNDAQNGIDKIATGIHALEKQGHVLKIANGDIFQGTYVSSSLRGLPMLDALNAMEFDAFVIGNHEFDWGFDKIKAYKDGDLSNGEANFPFLGANIYDKATGKMVDWLEPYTIVEFGDIRIGIIGIIGDETESDILVTHVKDYDFVPAEKLVADYATELRTEQACDVVIVSVHDDNDVLNETLASYTGDAQIDAIFAGHSHISTDQELISADGRKICVLQNGGNGQSFANLTMNFNDEGELVRTNGTIHRISGYVSDGSLAAVFATYDAQIQKGNEVIGYLTEDYSKRELGIAAARSMAEKYDTDLAVINTGGVRTTLDEGNISYADVFQVFPFENEVYIVTIKGSLLKSYMSDTSKIYYWGESMSAIEDDAEYTLAIIDYVYVGSTFDAYRGESYIDTDQLLRDIFLDYLVNLMQSH